MDMKEKNQDSQKNFSVKEVSKGKQISYYLATKNNMVDINAIGTKSSLEDPRYDKVYDLLSEMESKLKKVIPYEIALSYEGLEALFKVFNEIGDDKEAKELFTKNISPRNFFYMLNDIESQSLFYGSDRIYKQFFSNAKDIQALDKFYNEFETAIDESFYHNIPSIYTFIRRQDLIDTNNRYLDNIGKALNGRKLKDKYIAFYIINEYHNQSTKSYLSDSSKEELSYYIKKINDLWDFVMEFVQQGKYYCIDCLYDIASLKFEVRRVNKKDKNICYIESSNKLVTIKGNGISDSTESSIYKGVYKLISIMESNLTEKINHPITLSYIGLEALRKVFVEIDDEKEAISFFVKNISPRNFFYMIRDIDEQNMYKGSDRIYQRFLSDSADLKALDIFYSEFETAIDESFNHNLSNVYLFTRRKDLNRKDKYSYLSEIVDSINDDIDTKAKKLSFYIVNEYFTDKSKSNATEASKDELFYKIKKINDNWKIVKQKTQPDMYYNLDSLYELAIAN